MAGIPTWKNHKCQIPKKLIYNISVTQTQEGHTTTTHPPHSIAISRLYLPPGPSHANPRRTGPDHHRPQAGSAKNLPAPDTLAQEIVGITVSFGSKKNKAERWITNGS